MPGPETESIISHTTGHGTSIGIFAAVLSSPSPTSVPAHAVGYASRNPDHKHTRPFALEGATICIFQTFLLYIYSKKTSNIGYENIASNKGQ